MTRALADGAEFVAQMDADLSHPPFYLPQLLGTMLSTNAGVVIGSRYVAAAACRRRGLRLPAQHPANAYVKAILAMPPATSRPGSSVAAQRSKPSPAQHPQRLQLPSGNALPRLPPRQKIVEIPIHFEDRAEGHSKMDLAVQVESALRPFLLLRHERARSRHRT